MLGELYPLYATYRALKGKDAEQQHKWLAFWIVYSPLMVGGLSPACFCLLVCLR